MRAYIYEWKEKYYFDEDDRMETFYEIEKYNIDSFSQLINIITNDFFPTLGNSASARTNIVFIFLFGKDDEEKWNKTFRILNKRYKFKEGGCCGDYKYSHFVHPYYYSVEVYIYDKIDLDLIPDELQDEVGDAKKFIILEFKTIRDI